MALTFALLTLTRCSGVPEAAPPQNDSGTRECRSFGQRSFEADYVWGVTDTCGGREARAHALDDLASRFRVRVKSRFEDQIHRTYEKGNESIHGDIESQLRIDIDQWLQGVTYRHVDSMEGICCTYALLERRSACEERRGEAERALTAGRRLMVDADESARTGHVLDAIARYANAFHQAVRARSSVEGSLVLGGKDSCLQDTVSEDESLVTSELALDRAETIIRGLALSPRTSEPLVATYAHGLAEPLAVAVMYGGRPVRSMPVHFAALEDDYGVVLVNNVGTTGDDGVASATLMGVDVRIQKHLRIRAGIDTAGIERMLPKVRAVQTTAYLLEMLKDQHVEFAVDVEPGAPCEHLRVAAVRMANALRARLEDSRRNRTIRLITSETRADLECAMKSLTTEMKAALARYGLRMQRPDEGQGTSSDAELRLDLSSTGRGLFVGARLDSDGHHDETLPSQELEPAALECSCRDSPERTPLPPLEPETTSPPERLDCEGYECWNFPAPSTPSTPSTPKDGYSDWTIDG